MDDVVAGFGMTWAEYRQAFQEHGWWDCREVNPRKAGALIAASRPACWAPTVKPRPASSSLRGFATTTRKQELWSVAMEAYEPDGRFNLPTWEPAPETELANPSITDEWPFLMTTLVAASPCTSTASIGSCRGVASYGRPRVARSIPWTPRSWGCSRVTGCGSRVHAAKCARQWTCTTASNLGSINCEHQWWFPELDQADKGYGLCTINCLVSEEDQAPVCGASYLRAYNVKVYKATPENSPFGNPVPCGDDGTPIICDSSDPRLKKWLPTYDQALRDAK